MNSTAAIRPSVPDPTGVDNARNEAALRRRALRAFIAVALVGVGLVWCTWDMAPAGALVSTCIPLVDTCELPASNGAFALRFAFAVATLTASVALVTALRARRHLRDDALALGMDARALAAGIRAPRQPEPLYLRLH